MKNLQILILSIFVLSGCATESINSTNWAALEPIPVLKERLSLWTGLNTKRLYAQIGPPTEKMEDESGNVVLVYLKEINSPNNKMWHCKVSFTINDAEEIIDTRLLSRNENVWGAYMPCVHIIKSPAVV
jgi:hypothetical protein